jgi:tripartite-type tricarboxylate transporter receptor subunit TctC
LEAQPRNGGHVDRLVIGAAFVAPAGAPAPYPNRPIRIVVPFGPGGFADIAVRLPARPAGKEVARERLRVSSARAKIFGATARELYFNGE